MQFLLTRMPGKSRSTIKSLLAHRQVCVDNAVTTRFDHPLMPGQQVAVTRTKVLQGSSSKGVKVVFEDPHLIVIEKRQGLLSIATDREKERTAFRILSDQAKEMDPKNLIFVVHRLDREASGLMMFARSREVQQTLQHAWQESVMERIYVAVVEGSVAKDQDTVTSWLKENRARVMFSSSTPGDGQKAITRYRVLARGCGFSLLEVKLDTGRKNQIRIHMKELGHSIVGDTKYGSSLNPLNRLCLHARVLAFRHPVTGGELRFETPMPPAFLRLVEPSQATPQEETDQGRH